MYFYVFFFSSRRRHTSCALVTGVQTCALPISDKPRIEANYLGDPEGFDLKVMVECARISLDIFAQKAFDDYRGAPIFPARLPRNDAELVEFVRAKAETVYHPVGTCRMGSDDAAVVDPQLRVRGIEGLRVVDASVMPTLPTGNTRSEEHTSELQSLMRDSYAVFCLKKKKQ